MARILATIADRRAGATALVDEHGTSTWSELDERVNRLIHALRAAGLGGGDTFAVMSGNRRELFECHLASAHGGFLMVPVNWHWVAEEVAYVLANSDARAFVADARFSDVAAEAVERSPVGTHLTIGGAPPAGFVAYEEVLAAAEPGDPAEQTLGGPMFYTSGTTGRPKGVRSTLTAGAGTAPVEVLELIGAGIGAPFGIPADGTTLLCGPMYHSAQWAFSLLPMLGGNAVVMRHRFVAEETLELIDRHGVTNVHLVPTQMARLLRVDDARRAAFSGASLESVIHGAAPCQPEVKRRMIEWWGPKLIEYYGGTEGAIFSVIGSEEWLAHPTSVGKPLDTVEVTVRRDDGSVAPSGEPGQLWVRSLLGMDFEYHKEPDKTASAHREPGVFTLGDIGFLDDEGYLHLTDRKIDMIISGGVNIYPAEIEMTLAAHPAVADVAVFGIPDDEFGEQVKAAVQLVAGCEASDQLAAELIAYTREHLAGYKAPRSVDFHEELPRHPTGKLYKRLLRDPYWEATGRRI